MGTVLKQKNSSFRARIRRVGGFFLIAVLAGFAVMAYQQYRFYTGKTTKRPNFDIGNLWNSEESSPALQSIDEADLVYEFVPSGVRLDKVVAPSLPLNKRIAMHHVVAREAVIVQAEEASQQSLEFEHFNATRKEVVFLDIPVFSPDALSSRYVKRLENDYLISPDIKPTKAKWFVEFSFAPSISYRSLKYREAGLMGVARSGNTRYTYGMTESYRNETDRAISSFYSGIDVGYNINNRLSVSAGLYYTTYGENISVSSIDINDYNVKDKEFYEQTPLYYSPENELEGDLINYDNRYSYFEIPINVSYVLFKNGKSDVALQAGAYFQRIDHVNALIYDFESDYYYWLPKTDLDLYKATGFGTSVGMSIAQNISNTVEVFVNPQFKFNLTSTFNECYSVEQKHYTSGLRLGVRKQLGTKGL